MTHLDVEPYFLIVQQHNLNRLTERSTCGFCGCYPSLVSGHSHQTVLDTSCSAKAYMHVSHSLCKQAVSNLSSHSKKSSFLLPSKMCLQKCGQNFFGNWMLANLSKLLFALVELYYSTAFDGLNAVMHQTDVTQNY